jgi:hypothetical protein
MADTAVRSNRVRQQGRDLLRPPIRTLFKSVTDGAETKTGLKEQTYG